MIPFGQQVAEPLKAMVMGSSLEDARHLAQQYDRMRQEAEAQVTSCVLHARLHTFVIYQCLVFVNVVALLFHVFTWVIPNKDF